MAAQFVRVAGEAGGRHQVGGEVLAARLVVAAHHGRLGDRRVGGQYGLDLAGFDPHSPHFDLVVRAAQELQLTVGPAAGQVAGAVHPAARGAVRVGDEPLGGEAGAVQVAAGHAFARQVQLARHPQRDRTQPVVEEIDPGIADRASDRGGRGPVGAVPGQAVRRDDVGLGRPVQVVQPAARVPGVELACAVVDGEGLSGLLDVGQGGESESLFLGGLVHGVDHRHGRVELVDPVPVQPAGQPLGTAPGVLVRHDQGLAVDQGRQDLLHRDVEADGRELGDPGPGPAGYRLALPEQQVAQRRHGHLDALGQAGGTGGVEQVGGVLVPRRADPVGVGRIGVRPAAHLGGDGRVVEPQAGDRRRHQVRGPGVRHREDRGGVPEQVGDAVGGVLRVDRKVGRSALEDRQQGHDQIGRAGLDQRDGPLGPGAGGDQGVRETVRPGVELRVRQALVREDHRGGVGGQPDLFLDHRGKGGSGGGPDRRVPLLKRLPAFGVGDELDVVHPEVGGVQHGAQDGEEVRRHPLDVVVVVAVGGVDEAELGALRTHLELRLQVEPGHTVLELHGLDGQPGRAPGLAQVEVVGEHLEHRVGAQVAAERQRFDDAGEGDLLVVQGVEHGSLGAPQEFGDGGYAGVVGAQRQGVHEEAHDAFEFGTAAVGRRGADDDVLFPGVAVQQQVERGEQDDERGYPRLLADGVQAFRQLGREVGQDRPALEGRPAGPRAAAGQGEARQVAAQLPGPVVDLVAQFAVLQGLLLPLGVVGELQRQRGESGGDAGGMAVVQGPQLAEEDPVRPAVGEAVVVVDEEVVPVRGGLVDDDTQQRPPAQGERALGLLGDAFEDFLLTVGGRHPGEVDEGDAQPCLGGDPQNQVVTFAGEARAEDLVPGDKVLDGGAQGARVQFAVEAEGEGHVVGGAAAVQVVEEPEGLLGAGGRQVSVARRGADRARGGAVDGPAEQLTEQLRPQPLGLVHYVAR